MANAHIWMVYATCMARVVVLLPHGWSKLTMLCHWRDLAVGCRCICCVSAGDRLKLEDASWCVVEGIRNTGEYGAVYNFRVGEYHTYFVGDVSNWGWAVWTHNLGCNEGIDHLDEMRVLTEREEAAMKATPSRNSLRNSEPPSFVPTWELHLR